MGAKAQRKIQRGTAYSHRISPFQAVYAPSPAIMRGVGVSLDVEIDIGGMVDGVCDAAEAVGDFAEDAWNDIKDGWNDFWSW